MKLVQIDLAILAIAIFIMVAPATSALELTAAGAKVGVVNPDNGDASVAFGGHVELTDWTSRWHVMPEILFWKDTDFVSDFAINGNVYYEFGRTSRTRPYLGAGLNINFYTIDVPGEDDHETELGLNILGGMLLPISERWRGFVEGRYVATDLSQVLLLGGLTVSFGS